MYIMEKQYDIVHIKRQLHEDAIAVVQLHFPQSTQRFYPWRWRNVSEKIICECESWCRLCFRFFQQERYTLFILFSIFSDHSYTVSSRYWRCTSDYSGCLQYWKSRVRRHRKGWRAENSVGIIKNIGPFKRLPWQSSG